MKPRPIGIVAGGGGPIGACSVLRDIISECQTHYGSWRSFEYPCINFYSFPYSETLLVNHNTSSLPSRELSYSIQQLKLIGMEIVVVPCFTMGSYLTYRNYGIELIEMGSLMRVYLEKHSISNPLVLCSERTRQSGYCDKNFPCHYPTDSAQKELNNLIEKALKGEKVDIQPLLNSLPNTPILCAMTTINAQLSHEVSDPRWINPNKVLAQHVVHRCFEGGYENTHPNFMESPRETVINY